MKYARCKHQNISLKVLKEFKHEFIGEIIDLDENNKLYKLGENTSFYNKDFIFLDENEYNEIKERANIRKISLITEENRNKVIEEIYKAPKHYDNSKGSIYKFANNQNLNSYEFDIIKRIIRCRKKGNFREDLEKTKFLIDLYLVEYEN